MACAIEWLRKQIFTKYSCSHHHRTTINTPQCATNMSSEWCETHCGGRSCECAHPLEQVVSIREGRDALVLGDHKRHQLMLQSVNNTILQYHIIHLQHTITMFAPCSLCANCGITWQGGILIVLGFRYSTCLTFG